MNIYVIRFQAVTVNNIDSGPNFLFWFNTNSASAKNGHSRMEMDWSEISTQSHMTRNRCRAVGNMDEMLWKSQRRHVCSSKQRERNESRSDWIHAEITDRRKRRSGESQTRKAVITVLQVLTALVAARVTRRVRWWHAALRQKLLLGVSGRSLALRVTVTCRSNHNNICCLWEQLTPFSDFF